MLHALLNKHLMLSRQGMGVLHFCTNRFTRDIRRAVWYPEGYRNKIDVTHIDFGIFLRLTNVADALEFVRNENGVY